MSSPFARRGAAALMAVALAAGVAACGGTEDEDPQAGSTSGSASASSDATDATVATDDPTASAYLSVGGDVELTPPGTTLRFGESAVIAWQPGQGRTAVLEVTVERVDETSFAESFEGWVITDEMKKQTPLFVQLRVANAGEGTLSGDQVPIAVIDDDGIRVQPTTAAEKEFEPCPGGPLPKKFKPGTETDLCLLYLLAPRAKFGSVGFLPVDEKAQPVGEPITWTGKLTAVGEKLRKGDKGKKGKKGKRRG